MRQFDRSSRVEHQLLRDISDIFTAEFADELPVMVTFTQVRVSKDLKHAKVYYSVLGDHEARDRAGEFIAQHAKQLRHLVAGRMRVRQVPEISFSYDISVEDSLRLQQLLNEIKSPRRD